MFLQSNFFSFASWYNLTKQDDDFIYLFIVFPKSQFISQVGNHNVLFLAFACLVCFLRHFHPLTHASRHFRSPLVLFLAWKILLLKEECSLKGECSLEREYLYWFVSPESVMENRQFWDIMLYLSLAFHFVISILERTKETVCFQSFYFFN